MSAPLTKPFRETFEERLQRSPRYRRVLLAEALGAFLAGDVATGKALVRQFVNATIGFEALAVRTGIPAKSLMRMLSATGNPTANNLFDLLRVLGAIEGGPFDVVLKLRKGSKHAA